MYGDVSFVIGDGGTSRLSDVAEAETLFVAGGVLTATVLEAVALCVVGGGGTSGGLEGESLLVVGC